MVRAASRFAQTARPRGNSPASGGFPPRPQAHFVVTVTVTLLFAVFESACGVTV